MGLYELIQMHGDILKDNLTKHFGQGFLEMSQSDMGTLK